MVEYIYDLGADPRYVLGEYIRPVNNIPIIHGDEELCCADLSESGIVVMEVPAYVAAELNSGRAQILARSELRTGRSIGLEVRFKEVTHFEIVASPKYTR